MNPARRLSISDWSELMENRLPGSVIARRGQRPRRGNLNLGLYLGTK